jgi:hypothetical protein
MAGNDLIEKVRKRNKNPQINAKSTHIISKVIKIVNLTFIMASSINLFPNLENILVKCLSKFSNHGLTRTCK